MDIVKSIGLGQGVRLKYKRKPKKQNADEWFGMGSRFFEGHLVDEALRCFHHAKRLGHGRAPLAIQICEEHGGHYLQPKWPRRRNPDIPD